jgi:hypothetical protein
MTSNASDDQPTSDPGDFQIIDAMLFHEFAVVDKQIVKVSQWLPPVRAPTVIGRYQGLVKRANGNKVIEDFHWDGFAWRNIRTGRFCRQKFYWRGLANDPTEE